MLFFLLQIMYISLLTLLENKYFPMSFRCRKLPRSHLFLLGFLMHHLHRVATEYESNNMTASNLAIVFGPTLLRRNEDTTSMTQVLETIHQARAVELLTIYVEVRTYSK